MPVSSTLPPSQGDIRIVSSLNSRRRILIIAIALVWLFNSLAWIVLIFFKIVSADSLWFNVGGTIIAVALILFSRKLAYYKLIAFLCNASLTAGALYITHEFPGSGEPSSLLLISFLPFITVFLSGKKVGLFWSIFLLAILILNYIFKLIPPYGTTKDLVEVIPIIISVTLVTLLYQDAIDKSESEINIYTQELHETLEKNKTEAYMRYKAVQERDESIKEIKIQKSELEKMNKLMVNRELAMVDLKKRIKELEQK